MAVFAALTPLAGGVVVVLVGLAFATARQRHVAAGEVVRRRWAGPCRALGVPLSVKPAES